MKRYKFQTYNVKQTPTTLTLKTIQNGSLPMFFLGVLVKFGQSVSYYGPVLSRDCMIESMLLLLL